VNPPEQPSSPASSRLTGDSAGERLLDRLNDPQRDAVTHRGGPLLVLAGAGSGKTRVITHRIAHLVLNAGVASSRIIAVTFTNKAAAEMRDRVESLLGAESFGSWIGTFHSLCLRLLRREAERIDLDPRFVIYDSDDQLAVVRRILKEEGSSDAGSPRSFLSRISRAKNAMESPAEMDARAFTPEWKLAARIYEVYQKTLRDAQAVDFDDLLLRTIELFREHSDVAEAYSSRCEHLLVDEYQDTNRPQYLLIRQLSAVHGNVFVVGDEDQSIYRFRGAEIRNILEFERDHDETRVIRLEQNYRSTGTIIQAAGALIAHNLNRKGKKLWTENVSGKKIELFRAPDDRMEATWVSRRVRELADRIPHDGMAVLYRTNAQSRQMEEVFRRDRIPYQMVGSVQFYDRKEVKDLLGYLKLTANRADDVSFRRVVNTPARGIGATTQKAIDRVAHSLGVPWLEAARHVVDDELVAARSVRMLQKFLVLADELHERAEHDGPAALLEFLIEAVDFAGHLEKLYPGLSSERVENVRALVSAAVEYAEETDEESLAGFLDRSALVADADQVGERPGVTMMTIHCAKGLEYPVVFVVGLEENLFPHAMSRGEDAAIEEERRLCYVAMTRARERLFLTHARLRRMQGTLLPNPPSRVLDEIPPELVDEIPTEAVDEGFFDNWTVREGGRASGSSAARIRRTARATLPPKPTGPVEDHGDDYPIGGDIRHPSFGPGRILSREGNGKHLKLTIHFSDHGVKKILPSYTQLQVRAD